MKLILLIFAYRGAPLSLIQFLVVNRIASAGVHSSAFMIACGFRMMENDKFLSEQAQLGRKAQTWFSQTVRVLEVEKSMSRGTC